MELDLTAPVWAIEDGEAVCCIVLDWKITKDSNPVKILDCRALNGKPIRTFDRLCFSTKSEAEHQIALLRLKTEADR